MNQLYIVYIHIDTHHDWPWMSLSQGIHPFSNGDPFWGHPRGDRWAVLGHSPEGLGKIAGRQFFVERTNLSEPSTSMFGFNMLIETMV